MPTEPTIEIRDETGRLPAAVIAWLAEHAGRALGEALSRHDQSGPTPDDAIRVLIVGDPRMAELHHRLCGVAGTTDVITIDLNRAASESAGRAVRPMDVDLLLCLDEAERQGSERGHAGEHELLLYLLHGILHCLGHDDHDDAGFAAMHAMEDAILGAIGVGAVFGRESRGGQP